MPILYNRVVQRLVEFSADKLLILLAFEPDDRVGDEPEAAKIRMGYKRIE
jgi:hypothetical protein